MYMSMYTDIHIHVYMDPCIYQHLELHLKPPLINVLVPRQLTYAYACITERQLGIGTSRIIITANGAYIR